MRDKYFGPPKFFTEREAPPGLTRRRALAGLGGWAAAGLCLGGAETLTGCFTPLTYRARRDGRRIRIPTEELARLRHADDLLVVHAEGLGPAIGVRRLEGGGLSALLLSCSHRGCALDSVPEGFDCPCHGSQFDASGAVRRGPAEAPLRRLPAQTDANGLWITVGS
ncbi:MAG: Rieske (2Fe-2S) protein [Deltaproteobacteria bacterium]|nr:Rieske (2Fe-2S) protein [Deltaproteobacteria bacterium]